MTEGKRIKAEEAAKRLGISIAKLLSWQRRGILPPAPLAGRKRYYTEEYVEQAKAHLQKYCTGREVRSILGIPDSALQKMVKLGLLSSKIMGGQRFYLREEVEELKKKCPTPKDVRELIKEQTGHSVSWLAKQLGISRQTLYTWLHKGLLSLPKQGEKVFITKAYVEELKKNLAQKLAQAHKIRTQVLKSREK